jgi:hypothetical protein
MADTVSITELCKHHAYVHSNWESIKLVNSHLCNLEHLWKYDCKLWVYLCLVKILFCCCTYVFILVLPLSTRWNWHNQWYRPGQWVVSLSPSLWSTHAWPISSIVWGGVGYGLWACWHVHGILEISLLGMERWLLEDLIWPSTWEMTRLHYVL